MGFGLALAIAPASAWAQTHALTLDDALRMARANNPAYLKVQNDGKVAAAQIKQSFGALFPSLNANLNATGFTSSRVTGENDYGQPVKLPTAVDFKGSSAQQGIGFNMKLFDGGAMIRDLGAARAQAAAVDAYVYAQAASLTGDVTRQYYAALRAARMIDVEKRLLVSAKDRLDRTEQLLRVAGSSPVDVLGARVEVASQEQQVARAEADARKQALALNEVMGLSGDVDYQLTTDIPPVVDPSGISTQALLNDALKSSPIILQADAAIRGADKRAAATKATRFPTISANANFGRSMSLSSYDALWELNPQNHGFNFGLSAAIPIFNNFRASYAIAQAEAAAADAKQDARGARLRVERQIRSALEDLGNSYKQLRLAEKKAAISRDRLELAQEQYRNGAMTFSDLQNVIDRTAAAEREAVDARFTYASALSFLEEYAGASLTQSQPRTRSR